MTVVSWRGVRMDQSTKDKLLLAEAWIQHDLKDSGFTLSFPQGSYSNGSLSAGTHSGGGVVDVHCVGYPTATKVVMMKYLRACLGFGWHRPYNWDGAGGGEHMHIGELGNPNMSSALAAQVVQWNNHTNGLASHGPDNDSIDVAAGRPARITTMPGASPTPPPPSSAPVLLQEENMSQAQLPFAYGAGKTGNITNAKNGVLLLCFEAGATGSPAKSVRVSLGADMGTGKALLRVAVHLATGWKVTTVEVDSTKPNVEQTYTGGVDRVSVVRCDRGVVGEDGTLVTVSVLPVA